MYFAYDFSRDRTLLASGSRDGTAILWSTATWKAVHTFRNTDKYSLAQMARPGMLEDVAFSPDGKTLAAASREGTVQLWDVVTGEVLGALKGHSGGVTTVAFSPDGRTLVSGGSDHTVRLWNVEKQRELMQLDRGSIELGEVQTLAFSPEGNHLLAGGRDGTAFWSSAPIIWNDPDRAAETLRLLLHSNADFQSRIRMLSENLRLHEALGKLDARDVRVRAALAATQANWHASRRDWALAVAAFDRLVAVDPTDSEGWLRTTGLLRVATALLYQNRPAVAAVLLQGGAKRRAEEGLPAVVNDVTLGFLSSAAGDGVRVGEELNPLLEAVNERLAKEPRHAGLLELRAELAGQWSDAKAQAADYTAAIEALIKQKPEAAAVDLKRLYSRRGNAYVALRQWQRAIDDYARVVTAATTDDTLLSNQALALAETMLTPAVSSDLALVDRERKHLAVTKFTDPWQKLAAAYQLKGDQKAIDQLVERRPSSAGPIGDLFTQGKDQDKDWRRAIAFYSKGITANASDARLVAKRARAYGALKNWEAAAGDWARAATLHPDGAKLLAEFARRLAAGGQVPLAKAQFEKSRALYERLLEADPENDLVAAELAQLLLEEQENEGPTRWRVLEPTEMKSKGGATLSRLDDDSVLAGGVNPPSDEYTVAFNVPERTEIHSIRLEALTHVSLPGHGPGRGTNGGAPGWFDLNGWVVTAKDLDGASSPRRLSFRAAVADYSWRSAGLGLSGGWNITWGSGANHTSVWNLSGPITLEARSELFSQMRFNALPDWSDQNLGRFRLSVSSDPAALDGGRTRFAAMNLADPWSALAAAYHLLGDQKALDSLLEHHPRAAAGVGDLCAANHDWDGAIAGYREVVNAQPADRSLVAKLAMAYRRAGRTREAVPHLAKVSAANPKDTILSVQVAALQAWFAQEKELAATRHRILAIAKGTNEAVTAERAAKACSILPSGNNAEREAALDLGRAAVKLGNGGARNLMALGMAEYRRGNDAAADLALLAAAKAVTDSGHVAHVKGVSALYRAMSLFRQGKKDEARKLAIEAAAKMKPLPEDEKNPLAGDAGHDDLIMWLAYKEAMAMIKLDAAPIGGRVRPEAK